MGYTFREILGDFGNTVLKDIAKNNNTSFSGFEIGFVAYYKGISAGLTYYQFDENIPGFSNGQVTGRISFDVDLFEL